MSEILVTGCAGFIGFHVSGRLLVEDHRVVGIDNLNDYYDVNLKNARLARLADSPNFRFERIDLADRAGMTELFSTQRFDKVVNLAAQVGPRYSLVNPHAYVDSNLVGFLNVLEGCRHAGVQHLAFASSSSIYGANTKQPFSVTDQTDQPVSLYAATKKANELMAHAYAHLFGIPCTGLRFFTVYGPWGRPDMAPILFARAITEGRPIDVFNYGQMKRDFTYIDDVVEVVLRLLEKVPGSDGTPESRDKLGIARAPYQIYNVGNNNPVALLDFIRALETAVGKEAKLNLLPPQPGDVPSTWADIDDLSRDIGFRPQTPLGEGMRRFVDWFREYYRT